MYRLRHTRETWLRQFVPRGNRALYKEGRHLKQKHRNNGSQCEVCLSGCPATSHASWFRLRKDVEQTKVTPLEDQAQVEAGLLCPSILWLQPQSLLWPGSEKEQGHVCLFPVVWMLRTSGPQLAKSTATASSSVGVCCYSWASKCLVNQPRLSPTCTSKAASIIVSAKGSSL